MEEMVNLGILSLIPPILAIILALITKEIIISLFASVLVAGIMLAGFNPIQGIFTTLGDIVFPAIADVDNVATATICLLAGAFGYIVEQGGGAHAFANALTKKITTRKGAKLLTAAGGTAIFFSDATNPVLVGPIFRPITDALKVSREKLAYLVDSTTATMPSMFFFTAWGAYLVSIVGQQMEETGLEGDATVTFMKAVPFMFYTIGAVIMTYIISGFEIDFGPMKKAENRAKLTGKVVADSDKTEALSRTVNLPEGSNPKVAGMVVPIIVLLCCIFGGILYTGGFPQNSVLESFSNASTVKSIIVGFLVACIVAMVYTVKAKVFTPRESIRAFFTGISQMSDALLILCLSWGLGKACKLVGTTNYVIEQTQSFLTPTMMFVVLFIVAAFTAFCTGTSWGTFAIFLPISIPLAVAIGAPIAPAIGLVVSGGIFGDHCSPISDTTVLSSMGSSCNHIAHVTTQLPYAVTVAVAAAIAYFVTGFTYTSLGHTGAAILGIVITVGVATAFAFVQYHLDEKKNPSSKEGAKAA